MRFLDYTHTLLNTRIEKNASYKVRSRAVCGAPEERFHQLRGWISMPEPTGAAVTPADPMSATPFNNNNNNNIDETVVKEVVDASSATVSSRF